MTTTTRYRVRTLTSLLDFIGNGVSKREVLKPTLPRSVVTHDSIDDMELGNLREDSPRFKRITQDDAPVVTPDVPEPAAIDITTATPDEVAKYQEQARAVRAAKDAAPPYRSWPDLTADLFRSYHTHNRPDVIEDAVDPSVELHKRVMPKIISQDEHAESRNVTRDDASLAAIATMAASNALKDALEDELQEQARESQDYQERRHGAQSMQEQLD